VLLGGERRFWVEVERGEVEYLWFVVLGCETVVKVYRSMRYSWLI